MKGIFPVLEYVVSIPSHNHTRAFFRQLQNHAALNIPQKVSGGKTIHHTRDTLMGKGIREQAAAGRMLTVLLYKFRSKTGLQGNLIHQFLVIERNSQSFRNHAANRTATGTELTADGNNFL